MSYAFFQKSSLTLLEKWPDIFENEINGSFVDWCKNISLNLLFLSCFFYEKEKYFVTWKTVWVSFVVFQIWADLPNMDIKGSGFPVVTYKYGLWAQIWEADANRTVRLINPGPGSFLQLKKWLNQKKQFKNESSKNIWCLWRFLFVIFGKLWVTIVLGYTKVKELSCQNMDTDRKGLMAKITLQR